MIIYLLYSLLPETTLIGHPTIARHEGPYSEKG
jgi:hypothetical protein